MGIRIEKVAKRFGHFVAIENASLDVATGELVALLGPSGSGKTTLLRIIAGLEMPDSGTVILHGEDAAHKTIRDRRVGFVFQHYALFRHMSVFDNISFGLRVRPRRLRPSKAEIHERVCRLLQLVQLENLATRYPGQLSGGQRQRVALARALAMEPRILLLDEPFGALDAKVRKELRRWLRRLHDELNVTSVFVTHDQEEALEVADRVVILNEGRIEQVGSPEDVYHHPANPFVYHFLGDVNLFHGRMEEGHAYITGHADDSNVGMPIFVRPHLLDLDISPGGTNAIQATVEHINPAGPYVKVELTSHWGASIHAAITQERYRELGLRRDMQVYVMPIEAHAFSNGMQITRNASNEKV